MESSTSSERTKRFIQKYGIMAIIMPSPLYYWRDGAKHTKQKYGWAGCFFSKNV